ncbi:uncharacterized protein isoform X2 [Castor canadensis]|uniref:Uncharacterized protein isoform X2 n=1 Tax=Castor canadensis TaxID=51338 RepID=A0AC58MG51_CASCN
MWLLVVFLHFLKSQSFPETQRPMNLALHQSARPIPFPTVPMTSSHGLTTAGAAAFDLRTAQFKGHSTLQGRQQPCRSCVFSEQPVLHAIGLSERRGLPDVGRRVPCSLWILCHAVHNLLSFPLLPGAGGRTSLLHTCHWLKQVPWTSPIHSSVGRVGKMQRRYQKWPWSSSSGGGAAVAAREQLKSKAKMEERQKRSCQALRAKGPDTLGLKAVTGATVEGGTPTLKACSGAVTPLSPCWGSGGSIPEP